MTDTPGPAGGAGVGLPGDVLDDVVPLHYTAFPDPGADDATRAGNPAAVVLDAAALTDTDRLSIAARLEYSETAFVETLDEHRHSLRFFSPQAAVAFCGHATVAAAVALTERDGPGVLRFETLAGEVEVTTTREDDAGVAVTLESVPTRTRPMGADELDDLLAAVGWHRHDLDERYPPHIAYAGNDHAVLVTHDRAHLAELAYDFPTLAALMRVQGWTTVHLVHPTSSTVFHARGLFPPGGVVEDPATGSAAAAFGGYLRRLGLVTAPTTVTVLQGHDMGRPCRIDVDVLPDDDRVRVHGTAARITDVLDRPAERPAPTPLVRAATARPARPRTTWVPIAHAP